MAENRSEQFLKYVIPSMLAMVISGLYGIVDGFFIGRAMGDGGLAACNIAWPLMALLIGIGVGIGTGGSIIMSIALGKGDTDRANKIKGNTLFMLVATAIVITVIYFFLAPTILYLLGARNEIYDYATGYIRVITYGCVFQILGTGLMPIIKNIGRPIFAMTMMIAGMIINIILDALLVAPLGLAGVALATCIAQGVVAAVSIFALIKSKIPADWWKPNPTIVKEVLRISASPFGLSFAPSFVIILCNLRALTYGGTVAVAAYTVMSYAAYVVYSIMQGLADGVQPLISYCEGANDHAGLSKIMKKAAVLAALTSVIFMIVCVAAREAFPIFYGASPETVALSINAMLAVGLSVPFIAAARIMSAYFYATNDSLSSGILVYTDPFIFEPIFLLVLPIIIGIDGIWLAYPLTQMALTVVAVILKKRSNNKRRIAAQS